MQESRFLDESMLFVEFVEEEDSKLLSVECVSRLNLEVSMMSSSMVIDTLSSGLVTTYLVCLNYTVTIFGRDFGVELVCFPLIQLDVILGMNWMELNHVFINCFDKSVQFLNSVESTESSFMTTRHVEMSLSESAHVFMILVSLSGGIKRMVIDLLVVCDFPEVFPNDINDLPPER